MKQTSLTPRIWAALVIFGLFGQVAWVIENMYFNVFLYNTVSKDSNAIAVMVAASAVTATLTTLLMGSLSDRLGRRKLFIVAGYLIWGLTIMSFALISVENTQKIFPAASLATAVAVTVAIVVIMDCVMTFFGSTANDAAFNAWVTDVTNPGNRGKAEGLLSALPLLAMLLVFGLFDPLKQQGLWDAFFLIIGGMVFAGGLAGFFIIQDKSVKSGRDTSYFSNIIYGFRLRVIRENRALYLILIAMGVFCTAEQVFMPYLIIYMEHYLGIADYALLLGVVLILASAASVIMGRLIDKYGKQRFLYPAGAAFSAGLLILYASGKTLQGNSSATMLTLAIFGTIMMAGSLVLMATLSAGMRDLIPEEKRGHYSGIRMIFFVLLPMVIGPFIGSAVIKGGKTILDEFGFVQDVPNPEMFLAAAAVSLLAFIPYALVMREWKRGAAGAE